LTFFSANNVGAVFVRNVGERLPENRTVHSYLCENLQSSRDSLCFLCERNEMFRNILKMNFGRSQLPRSLRHELSSRARTLGSWVRIPHKAWMFAFILCLCR
jgi:hypothetical protein